MQLIARRTGLVTGPQLRRRTHPVNQPTNRLLVMEHLLGIGHLLIRAQHPDHDPVLRHIQTEMHNAAMRQTVRHGRLLSVCGSIRSSG